jgi:hypothetical protein
MTCGQPVLLSQLYIKVYPLASKMKLLGLELFIPKSDPSGSPLGSLRRGWVMGFELLLGL